MKSRASRSHANCEGETSFQRSAEIAIFGLRAWPRTDRDAISPVYSTPVAFSRHERNQHLDSEPVQIWRKLYRSAPRWKAKLGIQCRVFFSTRTSPSRPSRANSVTDLLLAHQFPSGCFDEKRMAVPGGLVTEHITIARTRIVGLPRPQRGSVTG